MEAYLKISSSNPACTSRLSAKCSKTADVPTDSAASKSVRGEFHRTIGRRGIGLRGGGPGLGVSLATP